MTNAMLQDGYICNGAVIFGGLHRGGYIAKGYSIGIPTLTGSAAGYRNTLQERLTELLSSLDADARLQVTWSSDSDYRSELLSYHDRTEAFDRVDWSARMRNERFTRYLEQCRQGTMRRERVTIFVTRPLSSRPTTREDELKIRAEEAARSFDLIETAIRDCVASLGGLMVALNDCQLGREFARYLAPFDRSNISFESELSILQNLQPGDGVGVTQPSVGFYLGGAYFGVITFQSLPQATCSGIVQYLTGLPICNVAICANVTPLVVSDEIAREEGELAKLVRAMRTGRHPRMEAAAGVRERRIAQLASGSVAPFRSQLIIRVWDSSMEGLQAKLSAARSAVLRMKSAKPYEAAFPTSAVNLYRCSMPGWSFDRYRDHEHYMEDRVLANLLPMSGSFDPGLETAEAIYDDGSGGLIGVSGFGGQAGAESPRNTIVFGTTGGGKSMFVNDLLAQTNPHYGFTVIIDDGFSYGGLVRVLGGRSFIIEAHGEHTFNYLDPQGALTPLHLADAEAILLAMCGNNGTDRCRALLAEALRRFYADVASDWFGHSVQRLDAVCREAIVLSDFIQQCAAGRAGAWADYFEAKLADPEGFAAKLQDVTAEELFAFRATEKAEQWMERLAFALMARDEAPTHSDFCQFLEIMAMKGDTAAAELEAIAQDLRRWDRDGPFGPLFDGVGNFDFNSSLIHLELGRIPEASKDLKRVALLLICNQVKNELTRRPRSERKRVVFEEMSSLLDIPDAERVVRDFSERGRKYGIWIIGVIQQLGERAKSPAFASIVGNFRQIILFKQRSAGEAGVLAEAFQLPESARELLVSMPNPSSQRGASFLLCSNDERSPVVRLGCNVVHQEMLFIAGSSGDQHERREAAIAEGRDLLDVAASGG